MGGPALGSHAFSLIFDAMMTAKRSRILAIIEP